MDALGNDPEEDEVVEGVVADVVKAAVVFVCPCAFLPIGSCQYAFQHVMSIEMKTMAHGLSYNTESSC